VKTSRRSIPSRNCFRWEPADILLCRTETALSAEVVPENLPVLQRAAENVIPAEDVSCLYEIPLRFSRSGLDERI
jgi:CTP synthase